MSGIEEFLDDFKAGLDPAVFKKNDTRFQPKLRFEERCQCLALSLAGVAVNVIAAAYGLDRRTVGHIINPQSPHYKNVRREVEKYGRDHFITTYLTPEVTARVNSQETKDRAAATYREYAKYREKNANHPNRRANGSQGTHPTWHYGDKATHMLEVKWLEPTDEGAVNGQGWYVRDMDDPREEMRAWCGYEHTLMTSAAALKYGVQELCQHALYKPIA